MKEDRPINGPSPKPGPAPSPQRLREPSTDTTVQRVSRWSREIPLLASLRVRLILLVLVGTMPILGLLIYAAFEQREQAFESIRQEALQMMRMGAERQHQVLESAQQLLTALSSLREVENHDQEACERLFANLIALHPVYANIGGTRPDGTVFASAVPLTEEVDLSERRYIQQAMVERRFAVGESQIGRITKKASLNVGYPITSAAGELRGVIYAALDLTWLKTMLTNSTLPKGSSLTVMDRNFMTLVRYPDPEGKYVGQVLPPPGTRTNAPPRPFDTNALAAVARERKFRRGTGLQSNEVSGISVGRDGVQRLYASTRLSYGMDTNTLRVTVGIPVEVAYGPANRVLMRNLLVVGLVTAGAMAMAWFGGSVFVLRRVKSLLRATDRIGVGDYSARVGGPYGAGELHLLAKAFDDMAAALQRRTQEREKAEAKLRALNEELESRVTRRTTQLKRSNEDLEQFAYVASHDLQEPLRMVSRYVELLRDRYGDQFDTKAKEFLGFALDGARRMEELILALLAYSRVDTQGQPFERTDCNEVVESTLSNLRVAIEDSHAVVTVDPLPKLMADEVQLGQLFQNLLGNAIKFRGNKPPEIRVSAKQEGDDWHFAVRDNGIGVSEENFPRIFVIFQRLHTRTKYPGTGIGLSLCKKIVERHGGRIWVESRLNEGSTFHFTLPARHEPPTQIKPGTP